MSTINKQLGLQLLKNNGHFEDDPVPALIYFYKNIQGEDNFAVFYDESHDDIRDSPFVVEYKLVFTKKDGVLEQGKLLIQILEKKGVRA